MCLCVPRFTQSLKNLLSKSLGLSPFGSEPEARKAGLRKRTPHLEFCSSGAAGPGQVPLGWCEDTLVQPRKGYKDSIKYRRSGVGGGTAFYNWTPLLSLMRGRKHFFSYFLLPLWWLYSRQTFALPSCPSSTPVWGLCFPTPSRVDPHAVTRGLSVAREMWPTTTHAISENLRQTRPGRAICLFSLPWDQRASVRGDASALLVE